MESAIPEGFLYPSPKKDLGELLQRLTLTHRHEAERF
jgi:hypothetical protein